MTGTRPFDPALFRDAAIDRETASLNTQLIELLTGRPEWWITGAQEARAAGRRAKVPPRRRYFRIGRASSRLPVKMATSFPCE
jgi:hypothetical protein